jgi:hypothetical protein
MATQKPVRPVQREQVIASSSGSPEGMRRAIGQLEQLARIAAPRKSITVDLIVGDNRIAHGLGRMSRGAFVSPSVADATFAYSHAPDGDRIAVITVVGVAQPGALVEII